ncbi:MAG: exodeoxyribonuclease VII small subunit [Ruminococcaceae bacterium]|nr:exodeoxyribonuclease VII small subunit [Oscillospiraceae bacterium]
MDQELSFEAAMARLEQITKELDSGAASLDDSLKLFEEGVKLVRFCNEKLENAKLRVLKISTGQNEQ